MVQALTTLDTVFRKNYKSTAIEVMALRSTSRILIILEQTIHGLTYLPDTDTYEEAKTLHKEPKGIIQTARLSPNEQILAISTLSGNAPIVELYLV